MNDGSDEDDVTDGPSRPLFKPSTAYVIQKLEQLEARCQALEDQCKTLQDCLNYKAACSNCAEHIQRLLNRNDVECPIKPCCFPFP